MDVNSQPSGWFFSIKKDAPKGAVYLCFLPFIYVF